MLTYTLTPVQGPSGPQHCDAFVKNFCFRSQLPRFRTSPLLTKAFPIRCPEARPGSATLESTELFLSFLYIGEISFLIWENPLPLLFIPRCFFFTADFFLPLGLKALVNKSQPVLWEMSVFCPSTNLLVTKRARTCLMEGNKRRNIWGEKIYI